MPFARPRDMQTQAVDTNATVDSDNPLDDNHAGSPGVGLIAGAIILGIVLMLFLLTRIYQRHVAASRLQVQTPPTQPQVSASGILQRIPTGILGELSGFSFKRAVQFVARWIGRMMLPGLPRYVQRQGRAPSIVSTRSTQPLVGASPQRERPSYSMNNSPRSAFSAFPEDVPTPSPIYAGDHGRGDSSRQSIS